MNRWESDGRLDARYASEWRALLARPLADIRERIGDDTESARDLRQNSPLAGMLSEPERQRILEQIS